MTLKKTKHFLWLTGFVLNLTFFGSAFANTDLTAACPPDPTGSQTDCNVTTAWQAVGPDAGATFYLECPTEFPNFRGASYDRDVWQMTCWAQNPAGFGTQLWGCQNWVTIWGGNHYVDFSIHCSKN